MTTTTTTTTATTFSPRAFRHFVRELTHSCSGIGCSIRRRDCRQRMTDQIIDQWAEKKGTREAFIQAEALKMALPEVMRSYYARTSTGYVATTEQLEPDYRKLVDLLSREYGVSLTA